MKVAITDEQCREWGERPPGREAVHTDIALRGFYVRVSAAGTVSFYARATVDGRRAKPVRFGTFPAVSTKAARKRALEVLGAAAAGVDAGEAARTRRAERTVAELADAYLASREFAAKAATTQAEDRRRIATHIVHHVGTRRLSEVTPVLARRLRTQIEEDQRVGRRGHPMGGPGVAAKAVRTLSAMLSWAAARGDIAENPLVGKIRLCGDGVRDAVIEGPQEYARLFETMDRMVAAYEQGDASEGLRPAVRDFIEVVAATGLRKSEALGLRWRDVDFARDTLRLPATKGARLRAQRRGGAPRPVTVAAPPVAAAALGRRRAAVVAFAGLIDPDALMFEGERRERPIAVDRDWRRVRAAADLDTELTIHGLRHSLGTAAALSGMDALELMRVLRHASPSTTTRYIHIAQERERLADRAAEAALGPLAARGKR